MPMAQNNETLLPRPNRTQIQVSPQLNLINPMQRDTVTLLHAAEEECACG